MESLWPPAAYLLMISDCRWLGTGVSRQAWESMRLMSHRVPLASLLLIAYGCSNALNTDGSPSSGGTSPQTGNPAQGGLTNNTGPVTGGEPAIQGGRTQTLHSTSSQVSNTPVGGTSNPTGGTTSTLGAGGTSVPAGGTSEVRGGSTATTHLVTGGRDNLGGNWGFGGTSSGNASAGALAFSGGASTTGGSQSGGANTSSSSSSSSPYKGVANSPAGQIKALGATWCYNWGTAPKATDCDDPLFVPMVWGSGDVAGAIKSIGKAGYKTVLGFNEPNKKDQANMTVAEAITLWPTVTSNPDIRVGSPAVSDDGRAWLVDFMTQVKAKGLRVDFIAMHWYGWNAGSCTASQLEGAVNWASQWGLPIWITEFGCMGSSNPNEQTVLSFFNDAIKMIAKHPLVERYAWYPWNTYNHLYENDTVTSLGKAFTAAAPYRQ